MASSINALTSEAVIPFERLRNEKDNRKVTLMNTVTIIVGNVPHRDKRTLELFASSDGDIETLIRLVLAFMQGIGMDGLAYNPTAAFNEFRKCLSDIVLDVYDDFLNNIPVQNRDLPTLAATLRDLIGHFCNPTAFPDQKRYMDTYKKPFKMDVRTLSNRLILVNKYTAYLPGSNGIRCYDEVGIKYALFNMMLPHWQLAFASSATQELNDPTYTFQQLVRFMITQETISNRRRTLNQGRGRGRMPAGRGRFGRENQPFGRDQRPRFRPYPNTSPGRSPFRPHNSSPFPQYQPSYNRNYGNRNNYGSQPSYTPQPSQGGRTPNNNNNNNQRFRQGQAGRRYQGGAYYNQGFQGSPPVRASRYGAERQQHQGNGQFFSDASSQALEDSYHYDNSYNNYNNSTHYNDRYSTTENFGQENYQYETGNYEHSPTNDNDTYYVSEAGNIYDSIGYDE